MSSSGIVLIPLALFIGMLVLGEVGRAIGRRRIRQNQQAPKSFVALEGAVFGLMGLLIAFTFSSAAVRFEQRRQMVVEEANTIGTAWLRLSMLPEDRQPALRHEFRKYLDSRINFYSSMTEIPKARQYLRVGEGIQDDIWKQAVEASSAASSPVIASLVLPPINAMIDTTTTGVMLAQTHLPGLISVLLGALMLMCALLSGFESAPNASRSWVHTLVFALMLAMTLYVILDLDYPRLGLIRIDDADTALIELKAKFAGGK